jgi:plasmid stabilization system protein ParE
MAHRIEWNKRAINELRDIITYLVQHDARHAVASFNQKVKDKIVKIDQNITIGRKAPKAKTICFVLIGKYHRLYYRKIGATLRIVCFFDTRQDPSKRPY